jgi:hydrogenase 3 maturation protease
LPLSWKEQINQYLQRLWKSNSTAKVVVVGVGNELMGDDAAGMLVVQQLGTSLPVDSLISIVEAGPAPENCTGTLRRLKPELVVFIDAGDFSAPPGSIGLFNVDEAEGVTAFGHALPLHVLGKYIESEIGCKSILLLIQPMIVEYDIPVSTPVLLAVEAVVSALSANIVKTQ